MKRHTVVGYINKILPDAVISEFESKLFMIKVHGRTS